MPPAASRPLLASSIAVLGGVAFDRMVHGPRLPRPGEDVVGERLITTLGGKGANQAVAAARLDAKVALIGRAGADAASALAALQAEGVDVRHVLRDAEAPTGTVLIHVDATGETQTMSVPGANARLSVADVEAATDVIRAADWLLLQCEVPLACLDAAVRIAHDAGVRVLLDPAPPVPLPDALLERVDVIKPNAHEAAVLAGVTAGDRDAARAAAERLLDRGVGLVVIQAGGAGDLMVWRGGEHWLPRFDVRAVDATGAGDAFAAALAVGLAEQADPRAAGAFASTAAALATTRIGGQPSLPSRDAVEELIDRRGAVSRSRTG